MYRPYRLTSTTDFRKAREQGKSYKDRRLVVLVRPNGRERSRVGFVTSGRIGGAVERNTVRRLMREAARGIVPILANGYDVVVIATRQAVGASCRQIDESLQALLRRAGLIGEQAQR
ncbi:MAG: ribonuclease P protein component [Anaerolineae bacterium]